MTNLSMLILVSLLLIGSCHGQLPPALKNMNKGTDIFGLLSALDTMISRYRTDDVRAVPMFKYLKRGEDEDERCRLCESYMLKKMYKNFFSSRLTDDRLESGFSSSPFKNLASTAKFNHWDKLISHVG